MPDPDAHRPSIVARSLPEANQDLRTLDSGSAVVSIGEPGTGPPYGFDPDHPMHLRLECHDVLQTEVDNIGGRDIQPPTRAHVETLIDRAPILRTAQLVYCHCNAGISRAPAVAYILRCHWSEPGEEETALQAVFEDRPQASPNSLLVEYADDLLERDGAMLDALRGELRDL